MVEVESMISTVLEQADSVVYGVYVLGVEGKASMAAIMEEAGKFNLERYLNRIRAELPAYDIPLFICLVSTIDITGEESMCNPSFDESGAGAGGRHSDLSYLFVEHKTRNYSHLGQRRIIRTSSTNVLI